MSGSVNRVILIGNLGKDPEVRHMASGDIVVNFSLATSERWKSKDGEQKEKTEWTNIVVFNPHIAKVAEQYARKGSKVYVEGQLQTRKWQAKDGTDRYSTEVVLQKFRGELVLLDKKQDEDGGRYDDEPHDPVHEAKSGGGQFTSSDDDMNDPLPF